MNEFILKEQVCQELYVEIDKVIPSVTYCLAPRTMRGLGLYLDPLLSLAVSAAIARWAWPVGTRAAWTLLEGREASASDLESELSRALERTDVFLASLIFDYEQIEW